MRSRPFRRCSKPIRCRPGVAALGLAHRGRDRGPLRFGDPVAALFDPAVGRAVQEPVAVPAPGTRRITGPGHGGAFFKRPRALMLRPHPAGPLRCYPPQPRYRLRRPDPGGQRPPNPSAPPAVLQRLLRAGRRHTPRDRGSRPGRHLSCPSGHHSRQGVRWHDLDARSQAYQCRQDGRYPSSPRERPARTKLHKGTLPLR